MTAPIDLSSCDREPIHIPGAVQPHGVLLAADRQTLTIQRAAGPCERFFGCSATQLLGRPIAKLVTNTPELALIETNRESRYSGVISGQGGRLLDVVAHCSGEDVVLEFEDAPETRLDASEMARIVERDSASFATAQSIGELSADVARRFRALTHFDRVMVYRFLPDETGSVVAEDKADDLPAFLNHRYPASDIPKQARALYVRNVIRVIPDVDYQPGSLMEQPNLPVLDMSNCHLRSVSPIHVQYLKNMAVSASASMSIIRDGRLWGLVACHHRTPKQLSFDLRLACRLLSSVVSRQVAAIDEAELFKSRVRSRAAEDALMATLVREVSFNEALESHASDLLKLVDATGIAIRRSDLLTTAGAVPDAGDITALGDWVIEHHQEPVFLSDHLSAQYPPAAAFTSLGSGLLAATTSRTDPHQILWFRMEQIEEIKWAGNPHKPAIATAPAAPLSPRASFDLWSETVRGKSKEWSLAEIETATRLGRAAGERQHAEAINRLNHSLREALQERDRLLSEKDFLLREGDHRIQNSLQIIGGMLNMHLRESSDPVARSQLEEAAARVRAVAAVHRRLHKSAEPRFVDVDAYVSELVDDLKRSLGSEWAQHLRIKVSPVRGPTDVAMAVGLSLAELLLNVAKYAYGGKTGPVEVDLQARGDHLRLAVRDWGTGLAAGQNAGTGLGTRLIGRLLENLHGKIRREDADPGLRVIMTVPLPPSSPARHDGAS